jgi:5-methyltetrahydropteroyltriglutamate--homocysteine methyltransferase
MDAPNYAQWHVDAGNRAAFESWGHDMTAELAADAEIDDTVFAGVSGITRATHVCRGNAPGGRWLADGGYERIAGVVFPRLTNYDRLLLEFDTPRAGGFAPLRHVPKDKGVVLGLVSSKTPALEKLDDLKRRTDEAARYMDAGRLAISPQCGFASTMGGNPLTEADERAKLSLCVNAARSMWGQ